VRPARPRRSPESACYRSSFVKGSYSTPALWPRLGGMARFYDLARPYSGSLAGSGFLISSGSLTLCGPLITHGSR
jgi:hypothetical protein